jgi:hypothetical protein
MIRTAASLKNFELRARDGVLGKVKDCYFDDEHWTVRYLVVETGTWLNSRKVLIATSILDAPDWEKGLLPVNLTQEQVRRSPSVDAEEAVTREDETGLQAHYGWPAYWATTGYLGSALAGPVGVVEAPVYPAVPATAQAALVSKPPVRYAPDGDPRLRRANAVQGYRLEATDGAIGHLVDFLFEDLTWELRYLVIDTTQWLPGQRVVISPDWVSAVSWSQARVYIDLSREAIKAAPAYEPDAPWDEDYARRLQRHHLDARPRER